MLPENRADAEEGEQNSFPSRRVPSPRFYFEGRLSCLPVSSCAQTQYGETLTNASEREGEKTSVNERVGEEEEERGELEECCRPTISPTGPGG